MSILLKLENDNNVDCSNFNFEMIWHSSQKLRILKSNRIKCKEYKISDCGWYLCDEEGFKGHMMTSGGRAANVGAIDDLLLF